MEELAKDAGLGALVRHALATGGRLLTVALLVKAVKGGHKR